MSLARKARIARIVLGAFLALVGIVLAWEFVDNAPAWSNGAMEGVFYALGAVLLFTMAGHLLAGRVKSPLMYLCSALVLSIPGVWCVRWTLWLLDSASDIGPVPFFVPLLFGAGGLLCFAVATILARRAWKAKGL
jgi:hypothetical protein